MSWYTAAAILSLPNTLNGRVLALSLLTSTTLSVLTLIVGLIDPTVGFYTLFILVSIAPLTLIHHITIFCLLHTHQDGTERNYLVPRLATRKTNIAIMLLFEATWLAGTILGFTEVASTDMATNMILVRASYVVGLIECLTFLAVIVFCIRARSERSSNSWRLSSEREFCMF